jgi:hypothetical protein
MVTAVLVSQLEVDMEKITVNVPVNCTMAQYEDLAAYIMQAAGKAFRQIEVELDADEENNVIINLMELSE